MNNSTRNPEVFFVTSNLHKYTEINSIFEQYTSIQLRLLQINLVEIQSSDLEEIAIFALENCTETIKETPIFVEDSGLFIKSLNGFPGPYSAYIFRTLGLKGILTLMENFENREAYFQSSIALKIDNGTRVFTERVQGKISQEISSQANELLQLGGLDTEAGRAGLIKFDNQLRESGNKLNPGTTADLIAATLGFCILAGYRP